MNKVLSLMMVAALLAGCKMDDTMDATISMGPRMDKMNHDANDGMGKTLEQIRKQAVMYALIELKKPENALYLFPAPIALLKWGKVFGENATPEEVIGVVYTYIKGINSNKAEGLGPNPDGTWPSKEAQDRKKFEDLMALEAIAAMLPQEKVEALVEEEINAGGRYEGTMYEFLALRAAAIEGILIQESLFSKPMISPGMFEKGLEYLNQLSFIMKLPFKDKIAMRTVGFIIPENNIEIALDLSAVKTRYIEMKNKLPQLGKAHAESADSKVVSRIEAIKTAIDKGIAEN